MRVLVVVDKAVGINGPYLYVVEVLDALTERRLRPVFHETLVMIERKTPRQIKYADKW